MSDSARHETKAGHLSSYQGSGSCWFYFPQRKGEREEKARGKHSHRASSLYDMIAEPLHYILLVTYTGKAELPAVPS